MLYGNDMAQLGITDFRKVLSGSQGTQGVLGLRRHLMWPLCLIEFHSSQLLSLKRRTAAVARAS